MVKSPNLESLMSALARVLREDGKKSMELSLNIVAIFDCFSPHTELHHVITQNQIGDMCLRTIDVEIKRLIVYRQDIKSLEEQANGSNDKALALKLELENSKLQNMMKRQDVLLYGS